MISPLDIPVNAWAWLFGAIACLAMGIKSFLAYRQSNNLLTKYVVWFDVIMGASLLFFSVPSFFTADPEHLRYTWIIGGFLMYTGLIPQAAILWALTLRSRLSVYFLTVPTAVLGLSSWMYSTPNFSIHLTSNFINYSEPGVSSLIMALLLGGLFIPVGVHFLRATLRQTEFKDQLVTFALGVVYAGIGVSTAGHLLITGQVASVTSSIGNIAFFLLLLVAILWPWRAKKIKTPAVAAYGRMNY